MTQKRKNVNNKATLKKRKVLTFGEKKSYACFILKVYHYHKKK
jgi:hypothetical protein